MNFLFFGSIAYLLGSVPSAVWIGRAWFGMDVREHGSKNAGATNTFRILGKKAGITVLILDILKGLLAVLMPLIFNLMGWLEKGISHDQLVDFQITSAILVVLGHVFPLFANFNGGKGVATSLGVIIGIHPPAAGVCFALFIVIFILFQYVSLAAICAAIVFPFIIVFIFQETNLWLILFSVILSSAVILAHKKNIERLLKGEESKMKLVKK